MSRLVCLGILPLVIVIWLNSHIQLTIHKSSMETDQSVVDEEPFLRRNFSMVGQGIVEMEKTSQMITYSYNLVKLSGRSQSANPFTLRIEIQDLNVHEEKEKKFVRKSDSIQHAARTLRLKKRRKERAQNLTLFSMVAVFIICNIPRIILDVHQVIIIDVIK